MLDGIFEFIGGGRDPDLPDHHRRRPDRQLHRQPLQGRRGERGPGRLAASATRAPDGRKNLKVVRGGGVIVLPLIHKVGKLKLTARQINVNLADAVTRQGIKVAVQGVATFKIGADDESIRNAAERFLEAQEEEVDSIVKNVLEGSLRSIVGTLTVEELNLDRHEVPAGRPGRRQGRPRDVRPADRLVHDPGDPRRVRATWSSSASRRRPAASATPAWPRPSADQEAAVREAEAEQVKINAAARRRRCAGPRPRRRPRPPRRAPPRPVRWPRPRRPRRSPASRPSWPSSRPPARSRSWSRRPSARPRPRRRPRSGAPRATRARPSPQAQGDAERVKLAGEAQARVVEVTAEATAKQTTLEGNAEAGIVLSKGEAEAKALALRAEAYRQFNEAAIIQTVLSMLPDIVRAAAEPMANIDTPDGPLERRRVGRRQERDPDRHRGERPRSRA